MFVLIFYKIVFSEFSWNNSNLLQASPFSAVADVESLDRGQIALHPPSLRLHVEELLIQRRAVDHFEFQQILV